MDCRLSSAEGMVCHNSGQWRYGRRGAPHWGWCCWMGLGQNANRSGRIAYWWRNGSICKQQPSSWWSSTAKHSPSTSAAAPSSSYPARTTNSRARTKATALKTTASAFLMAASTDRTRWYWRNSTRWGGCFWSRSSRNGHRSSKKKPKQLHLHLAIQPLKLKIQDQNHLLKDTSSPQQKQRQKMMLTLSDLTISPKDLPIPPLQHHPSTRNHPTPPLSQQAGQRRRRPIGVLTVTRIPIRSCSKLCTRSTTPSRDCQ